MVPILQADSMELMEEIIRQRRPKWFLEIGTAIGRTSIQACLIDPQVQVVTIEKDPDMAAKARENIQKAGLEDRILLVEGDGRDAPVPDHAWDLIFIDAAKGQYQRFFDRFAPSLAKDGLIVSDNMNFHGLLEHPERTRNRHTKGLIRRLKAYRAYLESHPDFETTILSVGDGLAMTRRKT